ncbi:hypothetical protein RS9916_26614 [Synechococcus sp. RS9916]|nr:hypothetical protein RS9916_26614 [Synechococcus sp. RS9916]
MAPSELIPQLSDQRMTNLTASREPDHRFCSTTGQS